MIKQKTMLGLFVSSFASLFIRSFVRLFVRSFARSFVRSLVRSFVCSIVRCFGRSFVSSLPRFSVVRTLNDKLSFTDPYERVKREAVKRIIHFSNRKDHLFI